MDEKDQKILTITDILDQLTKPSITQIPSLSVQAPQLKPQVATPTPSSLTPPALMPKGGELVLPSLRSQAKQSETQSTTQIFSPPLTPQDSSKAPQARPGLIIRTMKDDLAKLKQGFSPVGFEFKRVVETLSQAKKELAVVVPEKKIVPPSQISLPRVMSKLPEIPKLPGVGSLSPGQDKLPQAPISQERPAHIHEEIKIADLGLPVQKKKTVTKSEEEKVEYRAIVRVISSGMTTGIAASIIFAVVAYLLIYYFFIREDALLVPTPTPTAIATPRIIQISELEVIFQGIPGSSFTVPNDPSQALSGLKSFIDNESIAKKQFKRLDLKSQPGQAKLIFSTLLQKLAINYPADLPNWLQENSLILVYGQTENFDNQAEPGKRIVFIVEIKDTNKISEIMRNWELTITNDLGDIFNIDSAKQATADFLDNERQGIKIRYKNFPFPDKSIDYAIVSSLTGKSYLILANSRESMYSPIDKIRGL